VKGLEVRDVLTILAIMVSLVTMIVVSRNARRATAVQTQNVDLARIRDLRSELAEAKSELDAVKTQAAELNRKLQVSNREASQAWTEVAELKRLAHRPGMTMETFRAYIGPLPPETEQ
jgi:peptidoglycan hydrolase CwlO-like protein